MTIKSKTIKSRFAKNPPELEEAISPVNGEKTNKLLEIPKTTIAEASKNEFGKSKKNLVKKK
jgi:hypothetical protein